MVYSGATSLNSLLAKHGFLGFGVGTIFAVGYILSPSWATADCADPIARINVGEMLQE